MERYPSEAARLRVWRPTPRNAAGDRQLKKSLDDEWKRCVKDKGLTPDSEVTVKEEKNIRQSTVASEEEIRIATIEAQCNQDVGRSQKLYDLEAQTRSRSSPRTGCPGE